MGVDVVGKCHLCESGQCLLSHSHCLRHWGHCLLPTVTLGDRPCQPLLWTVDDDDDDYFPSSCLVVFCHFRYCLHCCDLLVLCFKCYRGFQKEIMLVLEITEFL